MKKETLAGMAREYGDAIHNGTRYILVAQAYNDSDTGRPYRPTFAAPAIREDEALAANDTTDFVTLYEVVWDIINPDAENEEDCCDWDNPASVEPSGIYDPETGYYD